MGDHDIEFNVIDTCPECQERLETLKHTEDSTTHVFLVCPEMCGVYVVFDKGTIGMSNFITDANFGVQLESFFDAITTSVFNESSDL